MIDKSDWGYVPLDPDPNFSEEHNRKVIERVIRHNDKIRKRKKRENTERLRERTSAIASYIKSVDKNKSNMSPEDYFGKKYLTELRGQQIIDKLKNAKKKEKGKKA